MLRWPHLMGVVLGGLAGASLLSLAEGGGGNKPQSGQVLSECDGHLRELVVHYEPGAKEIAGPVYRQFLPELEADVTVRVVCPNSAAYEALLSAIGPVRCSLVPVLVNHPITTWSRDRWVALAPAGKGGKTTLWSPRGEAAEELWPARAGDERVAADLAFASPDSLAARRSSFYFDGGDFLADSDHVFVMPRVLQRNLQHTAYNREVFIRMLGAELKRPVILLDEAPDHHAGMFMASVGNRTMLVGDPRLGQRMLGSAASATLENEEDAVSGLPGADFSAQTQHLFDAVAAQCQAAGYTVVRVPTILGKDGRTYYTYVNALIDQQGARRIVYLPSYHGMQKMNQAARQIWEGLGYTVRPIDCTSAYRQFGCLHCLVNVWKREGTTASTGSIARIR